jgi:hypothetical protein
MASEIQNWVDCLEACHKRERAIRERLSAEDIESLRLWASRGGLAGYNTMRTWLHEDMLKHPEDDPLDWGMIARPEDELSGKIQLLVLLVDTIHSRKAAEAMRAAGVVLPCPSHIAFCRLSEVYSSIVGQRQEDLWPFDDLSPFSVRRLS